MSIAISSGRPTTVVAVYPVAERALPPPMTWRGRLAAVGTGIGALAEVLLVALVIPLGILLVGLPIALVVGLVVALAGRM